MPSNSNTSERHKIIKKSQEKLYHPQIGIRIRKDSNFWEPLVKAATATNGGLSMSQYMQLATREKLIRDGYMPDEEE